MFHGPDQYGVGEATDFLAIGVFACFTGCTVTTAIAGCD